MMIYYEFLSGNDLDRCRFLYMVMCLLYISMFTLPFLAE